MPKGGSIPLGAPQDCSIEQSFLIHNAGCPFPVQQKGLFMDDNKDKPVDQKDQNAGAGEGVKKEGSDAPKDQGTDFEKLLADKDAEIAKLATEKENYRIGMLKAKGKLPADDDQGGDDSDDVDTKIQKAVRDALYSEQERKLQAEKEQLLQQVIKENKELKTTLANKQGMTGSADGGSADDKTATPQYLSPEQIKELKARGWDDAKINKFVENLKKK